MKQFVFGLSGKISNSYIILVLLSIGAIVACLLVDSLQLLSNLIIVISSLSMLTAIISSYVVNRRVVVPIREIEVAIAKISKGEVVKIETTPGQDEISLIQVSLAYMIEGLQMKSVFASEIGRGNYDKAFEPLSEKDAIGAALVEMRNNLKKNAAEERKRNWSTAGMAQIGEILRHTNEGSQQLYDQLLTFIVKYLNANQGALFLLHEEQANRCLEMVSCYAYNRKKYLNKRIAAGEGLVGQTLLEKDTIYLTEVPEDYLTITSGLGNANPRCLLVVPLKVNDVVLGIIELASFHTLEKYQIEFVEKIAESTASTIASVKTNEITRTLLEETRRQTEHMRSVEEEMRQNMEELMATQENQLRLQEELKVNEAKMKVSLQELQAAKEQLERKEAELIAANEKSIAKSNKFREKMEAMDMELEGKVSQINMLKQANQELLKKLSQYKN